jgi:hypothetical protein
MTKQIDYVKIYNDIVKEHADEPDANKQAAEAIELIIEIEEKPEGEK